MKLTGLGSLKENFNHVLDQQHPSLANKNLKVADFFPSKQAKNPASDKNPQAEAEKENERQSKVTPVPSRGKRKISELEVPRSSMVARVKKRRRTILEPSSKQKTNSMQLLELPP